ncbi:MAG: tetratricopeptide repeat protein [Candidatus Rokubacteria bacterium]|nr:tetratricopeptide repeat protein [Candidatus Rokubacteria bacterium]
MTRRTWQLSAIVLFFTTVLSISPASAIDEPDRLWLVGEKAFADGLYPLARRTLERFVERYPRDARLGPALLMLGKTRFTLGDFEPAVEALQRAQKGAPPPAQGLEARFWEGEALFRLKRFSEARAAYDEVLRSDATAPFAADALYGYGWTELELKRPEPAVSAFRDLLQTWPEHAASDSAAYQLARLLVDLKRESEAVPVLADFTQKYPTSKLVPEAQYLLGVARIASGDGRRGVADLKSFIETHPDHERAAAARRQVTQQAILTGDKAELQEAYATLMSQAPPAPEALAEAFAIATRLGSPKDKEAAWKKLRAEFPADPAVPKVAFELANDAFNRKEWKDAVTYFEVAAKSGDASVRAESWLLAGESELKLKQYAAAEKAFEAVGDVAAADATVKHRALAGLGLAHEQQREYRAALTAYETVAAKSGDAALRGWAKERAAAVKDRLAKPAPKPSGKPAPKSKGGS